MTTHIVMTARGHTGKRHILTDGGDSLCGLQSGWESRTRARDETEDRLICKVCLRKEKRSRTEAVCGLEMEES